MALNDEQLKATEHDGGVALNAGAGAGKTTVLIAHFFYRAEKWIDDENNLKTFLKRTVLLTFSTKAALEIEHRLKQEIDKKILNDSKWGRLKENISLLFIGTIHSFFLKILKDSPVEGLRNDDSVVDEVTYNKKIKYLVTKWPGWKEENNPLIRILSQNIENVVETIVEIMQNPLVRENWSNYSDSNEKWLFDEIFSMLGLDWGFLNVSISEFQQHEERPWFSFLKSVLALKKIQKLSDAKIWMNILQTAPRRPNRGKFGETIDGIFEAIDCLKKFLKNYGESLEAQFDDAKIFKNWVDIYFDLVGYVENNYDYIPGLSFSDFEYKLLKKINSPTFFKYHQNNYDNFIIDEFQDTSRAQYDILLTLGLGKKEKFFVIGDIKQAIYGFRGGELQVFKDAQEKLHSLSLKNNYRSASFITNFNNNLFTKIFPMSRDWNDVELDTHSPYFEAQLSPLNDGLELNKTVNYLEGGNANEKLSRQDVKTLEQKIIISYLKIGQDVQTAILARHNKTLEALIPHLIENKISFTIEIKVPFDKNPLGQLVILVLKWLVDKSSLSEFLVSMQLKQMSLKEPKLELLNTLDNQRLECDLLTALRLYLNNLGVQYIGHEFVFNELNSIISLVGEDPWKVLQILTNLKKKTPRIITWGDRPELLKLLTSHASKGLEFDRVIIIGLWTSGRNPPDKNFLGQIPASIKWKRDYRAKKSYPSLALIYENLLRKEKEFSESKRLFYVACTRAKKELYFVKPVGDFSIDKSSWGGALKFATGISTICVDISHFEMSENSEQALLKFKNTTNFGKCGLPYLLPDLSVTRLVTAIDCSKKFYLQNILKWDENFLESELLSTIFSDLEIKDRSVVNSDSPVSTKERGIEIHKLIEKYVLGQITELPTDLKFIENEIGRTIVSKTALNSEYEIKFDFFGLTISGNIDLYVDSNDAEIWDFKTGGREDSKMKSYWAQLYLYAYGIFKIKPEYSSREIKLKLVWVDEKLTEERTISYEETRSFCFDLVNRAQHFGQENIEHCDLCQFRSYCRSSLVSQS